MRLDLRANLAVLRLEAERKIDTEAERVRQLFITPGSGQVMAYQQKRLEAEMVAADPAINPEQVPHIKQEADLNQMTLLDQAVIVLTMAHHWQQASAAIETRRLGAKYLVASAASVSAIESASQVDWSDIQALANP